MIIQRSFLGEITTLHSAYQDNSFSCMIAEYAVEFCIR